VASAYDGCQLDTEFSPSQSPIESGHLNGFKIRHSMTNADVTAAKPVADIAATNLIVTVAICTRNRAKFLERAVESAVQQMTRADELLIVDNASTDETPEISARLAATHPQIKVWCEKELGLSAARNAALKLACGEFVLFLDDDAVADAGWLAAYKKFFSAPPSEKIAVAGGAVLPDYEIPPPKWTIASTGFNLGDSQKRLPYRDSPWGCNVAYRREAAIAAGMFDTRLGRKGEGMMSREETDLNLRLQDAGYEIWWLPGAGVLHFMPASRLNFGATMNSWFAEGRSIAIQRSKSRCEGRSRMAYQMARLITAPFHAAVHLVAALFLLPFRRFKSAGHFFQACRICGFVWQLAGDFPHNIAVSK
jgi:GT2 family glycosyltransferase